MFSLHEPCDAAVRRREALDRREHDEALAYMRTEEFQRLIRPLVLEAMRGVARRRGP